MGITSISGCKGWVTISLQQHRWFSEIIIVFGIIRLKMGVMYSRIQSKVQENIEELFEGARGMRSKLLIGV